MHLIQIDAKTPNEGQLRIDSETGQVLVLHRPFHSLRIPALFISFPELPCKGPTDDPLQMFSTFLMTSFGAI